MRRGRPRTAAGRTHADRLASRDGYFAPESPIRRIGNTPLTPFLGGGPAVLLQVAHPLVAAGVVQHSDFRHDLWRRLIRTLGALYLITYGSKEEADRAGQAVQAVHEHVRGETLDRLGRFPAGTRYSASDPELQLWVHATLVESSLAAYQRFVRRLAREEQERYYREMSVVAQLFGVPANVLPRFVVRVPRVLLRADRRGHDHGHSACARRGGRDRRSAPSHSDACARSRAPACDRRAAAGAAAP